MSCFAPLRKLLLCASLCCLPALVWVDTHATHLQASEKPTSSYCMRVCVRIGVLVRVSVCVGWSDVFVWNIRNLPHEIRALSRSCTSSNRSGYPMALWTCVDANMLFHRLCLTWSTEPLRIPLDLDIAQFCLLRCQHLGESRTQLVRLFKRTLDLSCSRSLLQLQMLDSVGLLTPQIIQESKPMTSPSPAEASCAPIQVHACSLESSSPASNPQEEQNSQLSHPRHF